MVDSAAQSLIRAAGWVIYFCFLGFFFSRFGAFLLPMESVSHRAESVWLLFFGRVPSSAITTPFIGTSRAGRARSGSHTAISMASFQLSSSKVLGRVSTFYSGARPIANTAKFCKNNGLSSPAGNN
jgi:hypothetical protein